MDLRKLAFSIEFSGNESPIIKADKAMDSLKDTASSTTDEIKDMGKTLTNSTETKPLKALEKETKGLKSRFKDLSQGIAANMKYAKGEVDKLGKSVKDGTDTKPISKFSSAFMDAGKKINEVTGNISKKLNDVGKSFGKVGKDLTKKVTMPIVGLAAAGTKMALDLQQSIKKVTTLADRDILPVDRIEKEVRAISDASGIAQTEISEAAYSALSAGVDSAQVMDFVRSGIDLTRAGFTDMETAIDATTTVLNAYGDDAFEISKIHDIFVQTQDKGKISVDELGKSIGRVIPTASSLGVNMDQLGASYAILTAKGQNAQLATTNLNSMLDEMGKSGSNVDKVLREKTGKSFSELTKEGKTVGDVLGIVDESAKASGLSLKDMFGSGTAGSAAVTLLSEGVDGYNKSLEDMNNSAGKTAENAKTMEDGWLKIQKATTQVKNALIDAGGAIAPYVEQGAELISRLVDGFNSLDDGTKSNIMKFVGLAAVIGPVLLGVDKIVSIVGSVISVGGSLVGGISTVVGILGGPVTLAIGAVIGIGIVLYKNWDTIKEKAGQLKDSVSEKWNALKEKTLESWNSLKEKTSSAWENVKSSVSGAVDKVKDKWNGMHPAAQVAMASIVAGPIGGLIAGGVSLYKNWDTVKEKTAQAWDSMVNKIEGAVSKIKDAWEGLKDFAKNPIKGTVEIVRSVKDKVTGSKTDGSHADGLERVPFDGYIAELHKDEEVLTADDPRNTNNQRSTGKVKERVATEDGPRVTYSPIFNIEINGDATNKEVANLESRMKEVSRKCFDEFFYELDLKFS